MASTSTRQLFGRAITAKLPSNLIDASDLRQVPDTQEVLLDPDSDMTAILEVLQSVSEANAGNSLEEAIRFHFASLAHDNDAQSSSISKIYQLPNSDSNPNNSNSTSTSTSTSTPTPILCSGIQEISKFGKSQERGGGLDRVRIWLSLWRLENKNVDLVFSFNEPLKVVRPQEGNEEKGIVKEVGDEEEENSRVKRIFEEAVGSLQILDWGLFA